MKIWTLKFRSPWRFILIEIKKILKNKISLFSGINLDVDKSGNLNGYCDFIIGKSPEQFYKKHCRGAQGLFCYLQEKYSAMNYTAASRGRGV